MANPASSPRRGQCSHDDAPPRQNALGRHLVAKQHAGANQLGASERPQRKEQRHQEAIGHGGEDAARGHRELGLDRQGVAEEGRQRHGNEKAERDADDDADAGDQQHLQQVDAEDDAAGGADALEGGDDLAPAVDVGGDRVGDADAADQQRREPDQRQELAQPLQRARDLRRGIAPVAHREAALGQGLLDALAKGDEIAVGSPRGPVELERVAPADQAARLDEAGAFAASRARPARAGRR